MGRSRLNPILRGFTAGAASLQNSNAQARAEQERLEDRLAAKALRESAQQREAARLDADLRGKGYVAEGEAGDEAPTIASGRMLEDVLRASSQAPGVQVPVMRDQKVQRYGKPVGGYRYDEMSDAARMQRAKIQREEREANEPYRVPSRASESFSERKSAALQSRIQALVEGGKSLAEAHRQARMEVGESVPTLDEMVNRESPRVRDARRASSRNQQLANSATRELKAVQSEIGSLPDRADTLEGRIGRRDSVRKVRDSLQGEAHRYSKIATDAAMLSDLMPMSPVQDDGRQQEMRRDLVQARRAYDALLKQGGDTASAKRRYSRLVEAIRSKYEDQ